MEKFTAAIFSNKQDDDDGHLIVLGIAEELMAKAPETYLEQFARLGVFSKVEALANSRDAASDGSGKSSEKGKSGVFCNI